MQLNSKQFLGPDNNHAEWESARYLILPIPYEGAVSFGTGTAAAPEAVLDASNYLEFWDETFRIDPSTSGIVTLPPMDVSQDHIEMHESIYQRAKELLHDDKFPIFLGGDHSISSALFRALKEKYGRLACVQIDAHADLRDSYAGSPFSHASVMARIREMTPHALQLGIRSMSQEEAEWIERDRLAVCTMHAFRSHQYDWRSALENLPEPVYLTFDVDAFDWSVIASTGTPEPGGFSWDEVLTIVQHIFQTKQVIGCDVVELSAAPHDRNSPFAIAKLIYKMIGMHIMSTSR